MSDLETFRAEARAWLETTLGQPNTKTLARIGDPESMKLAKAYQAKKAAAGYAGLTWRKEVGGRELPPIFSVIFGQEEAKFQAPVGPFAIWGLASSCQAVPAISRCTHGVGSANSLRK